MSSNAHIVKTFNEAIAMLDDSESKVRDLIEGGTFDVAGINRTKVGDGIATAKAVADRVNRVRAAAIKKAFRHLKASLPDYEAQFETMERETT